MSQVSRKVITITSSEKDLKGAILERNRMNVSDKGTGSNPLMGFRETTSSDQSSREEGMKRRGETG